MDSWSDGIGLVGRYNFLGTGCWLLWHGRSAAVLEMPPYDGQQEPPALAVRRLVEERGLTVRYLLCSHNHMDHFSRRTASEFLHLFPASRLVLHQSFESSVSRSSPRVLWFQHQKSLSLGGEPLYLFHAPKHSWSDTMVIFRGVIFTGDWELNTIRSVHDHKGRMSVPKSRRRQSIQSLLRFQSRENYSIHKVFSVHANDRREHVDFRALMIDTLVDRRLW